jgi:chromosome partitioning protein
MQVTMAIVNQKGGVGKTTLTVHLAELAAEHRRVCVVDFDPQANTTEYFLGRKPNASDGLLTSQLFTEAAGTEPTTVNDRISIVPADRLRMKALNAPEGYSKLPAARLHALEGFDMFILDTPPAPGYLQTSALVAASCYLVPVTMDNFSQQGLMELLTDLQQLRAINPRLKPLGVLANRLKAGARRQAEHLRNLQGALGKRMLPYTLSDRAAIVDALDHSRPVWRHTRSASARAAGAEMRVACNDILERAFA